MAQNYVRGTTGSDAANGLTGATAKQHHSAVTPTAGDTINHAETQEATAQKSFSQANLTLKNEDGSGGASPAVIRGVHFPTFAATGTRSYRADIGNGKTVAGVIDRFASRIDSNGRHGKAYMLGLANAAAVDTLTTGLNGYFYDGTQWLYVQLNDNTDPTTLTGDNRVGWVESTVGCVACTGGGSLVQDLAFENARPAGATAEYPLRMDNGNNTVKRCMFTGAGVHSVVLLSSSNDTIEDCVFKGNAQTEGSGLTACMPIAAYSSVGNIAGLRVRRCELHCFGPMSPAGTNLNTNANSSVHGIYVHTDGLGGHVVTDAQVEDTWSYHYEQAGSLVNGNNIAVPVGDQLSFNSYALRVLRGGQRNSKQTVIGCSMAHKNAFMDNSAFAGASSSLYACRILNGSGANIVAFFGCTFVFDQGNQAGAHMFSLASGTKLILINCTIINRGLNASGPHAFFLLGSTTCSVVAHRCIFYNAVKTLSATRLMDGSNQVPAAQLDFQGNIYFGLASNAWGDNTTGSPVGPIDNTQTTWLANRDTTGQYIDPLFVNDQSNDPLVAGQLSPSSPLLVPTRKIFVPGRIDIGINGRVYDGTIGSWQYGVPLINMSRSNPVLGLQHGLVL